MRELSPQEQQRLLRSTLDLFCVASVDGYLQWVNPAWERALGYSAQELCARPFMDLVHPEDQAPTLEALAGLSRGEPAVLFENRYQHRDGSWRWLSWNSAPAEDGLIYCSVRDVTQLHLQQKEQREQQRLLVMAEEVARVGHWRVDLKTQQVYWSEEVFRIHGVELSKGTPPLEDAINAYHPEDRAMVNQNLERAIAEKGSFSFELRLIRADTGQVRYVRSRGTCEVEPRSGEVVAVFGVFMDLTEEHKARESMREANDLLRHFTYLVSHDLRSPLRGVSQLAEWIEEDLAEVPEETRAHLVMLRGRIQRMDNMLSSLHRFSLVGRDMADTEEVDVDQMVRDLVGDMELSEGFQVQRRDLPCLVTARAPLERVLQNLLSNAHKHHDDPARGRVEVSAEQTLSHLVIHVRDDGPGIEPRLHERAFEPFRTLQHQADEVSASGMGLTMVRRIAQVCGARVTLTSDEGQRGCTFHVHWPLHWNVG